MGEPHRFRLTSSGELLRNAIALSISGVGTKAVGFFVLLLLARRLGVDNFGKLNFAQTVVGYLVILANFGIPMLGIRTLAAQRANFREQVGDFLTAQLITGAFASVLLIAIIGLLPKSGDDKLLIALFSLNLIGSTLLIDWSYRAQEQMTFVALGNFLQTLLPLVLIVLFLQSEMQLFLVPIFLAAGVWGRNILDWRRFLHDFGWPRLDFRREKITSLLRRASTLGASIIMIQVYYSIDTLLLGLMRSDAEVGWYNAAYRIVLVFTTLAGIIGEVTFPRLSRQSTVLDAQQKSRIMLLGAKLLVFGSLPIALAGTFYSTQLMTFLFGSTYANGAAALQILSWQVFTVFSNVAFAYHLLAAEKNRLYFISVAAGAVINLSLNLVLIPTYGIVGAATTTIIAEVVVLSLLYVSATRAIAPVPMFVPLLKAAIAGLAFVAVAVNSRDLWPGLVLSTASYGVMLLATFPFAGDEIRRLWPWRIHESY